MPHLLSMDTAQAGSPSSHGGSCDASDFQLKCHLLREVLLISQSKVLTTFHPFHQALFSTLPECSMKYLQPTDVTCTSHHVPNKASTVKSHPLTQIHESYQTDSHVLFRNGHVIHIPSVLSLRDAMISESRGKNPREIWLQMCYLWKLKEIDSDVTDVESDFLL